MLTISQLASYAGVTVRAVRHYHAKGLLPEPERDHSGYRRYGAAAVVELIRIRTLAEAGVRCPGSRSCWRPARGVRRGGRGHRPPPARRDPERQHHRERIAQLAAGDSLALPPEAVAYLDRLRELESAADHRRSSGTPGSWWPRSSPSGWRCTSRASRAGGGPLRGRVLSGHGRGGRLGSPGTRGCRLSPTGSSPSSRPSTRRNGGLRRGAHVRRPRGSARLDVPRPGAGRPRPENGSSRSGAGPAGRSSNASTRRTDNPAAPGHGGGWPES